MVKKTIILLIFLGLGIFLIYFSIKPLYNDKELMAQFKDSLIGVLNFKSLFFILMSMVCGIISHYFRALRNILLIDPLGYRVRKTTAFYSVMTCYLGNLVFPRLGEVLRCTFLQRYDKVPFEKSLGTVAVDRILDLVIFAALFVLIIFIFINQGLFSELMNIQIEVYNKSLDINENINLGVWLTNKWASVWALKYIVFGIIIGLTVVFFIFKKISKKQSKSIGFFKKIAIGLWQGLVSVKDVRHPYLFIIYTVAIWAFYYFGVFMCMFAFDFLQDLGFMPPFVVLVVGAIGFMVAQGGLGAYPLISAGILVLYGVDYAQGLAAGWIGWGAQTLMILVVGFTTLILASFLKVENRAVISG
jgi:hypothetical protein